MTPGLFTIEAKGDEFVLIDTADEIIGRFSSRGGAQSRAKEIMDAAKHAADDKDGEGDRELFELKGVEIFRTGRWKGKDFATSDLDKMVDSFGTGPGKAGFRPPVKLGHLNKSGDPAFGWVGSIRREGSRLIADLIDLPKEAFDAIHDRRFDAVSAEIAFDMEVNGRIIPVVLLGIALLGSELPAVAGLKPLRDVAADLRDIPCGERAVFTIPKEDKVSIKDILDQHPDKIIRLMADLEQAQKDGGEGRAVAYALDLAGKRVELAEARAEKAEAARETSEKLFAMQADITDLNNRIEASHRKREPGKLPGDVSGMSSFEAGQEVDRRANRFLGQHDKATYEEAVHAVLDGDDELKTAYVGHEALEIIAANNPEPIEPIMSSHDAGVEIAKRVNLFLVDHEKATYKQAMKTVLDGDPVLAASYKYPSTWAELHA